MAGQCKVPATAYRRIPPMGAHRSENFNFFPSRIARRCYVLGVTCLHCPMTHH